MSSANSMQRERSPLLFERSDVQPRGRRPDLADETDSADGRLVRGTKRGAAERALHDVLAFVDGHQLHAAHLSNELDRRAEASALRTRSRAPQKNKKEEEKQKKQERQAPLGVGIKNSGMQHTHTRNLEWVALVVVEADGVGGVLVGKLHHLLCLVGKRPCLRHVQEPPCEPGRAAVVLHVETGLHRRANHQQRVLRLQLAVGEVGGQIGSALAVLLILSEGER
jgi:hypothetical protein